MDRILQAERLKRGRIKAKSCEELNKEPIPADARIELMKSIARLKEIERVKTAQMREVRAFRTCRWCRNLFQVKLGSHVYFCSKECRESAKLVALQIKDDLKGNRRRVKSPTKGVNKAHRGFNTSLGGKKYVRID